MNPLNNKVWPPATWVTATIMFSYLQFVLICYENHICGQIDLRNQTVFVAYNMKGAYEIPIMICDNKKKKNEYY